MSITIPKEWLKVDEMTLERLLAEVNWKADDFGFCIFQSPARLRIAYREFDGTGYVNPEFFKPA